MERTADARWAGNLREGTGQIRLGSRAFEGPFSFGTRFENAPGTNPEELLGAAHAACFSMALSAALSAAGHVPKSVETSAAVHAGKIDGAFAITRIDLVTRGDVPGVSEAEFRRVAEETKVGCIVSKALASVPMTLKATLVTA